MANKFTRNITNVKNILKQSLNTNNQNDLLSDDKHAYIRNKKEYHCLTDNVKSVNGVKADEKNEVVIPIGIEELNGSNRPSQKITILDSEGNDIVPSEKEYNLGMEHIYQLPKTNENNESVIFKYDVNVSNENEKKIIKKGDNLFLNRLWFLVLEDTYIYKLIQNEQGKIVKNRIPVHVNNMYSYIIDDPDFKNNDMYLINDELFFYNTTES